MNYPQHPPHRGTMRAAVAANSFRHCRAVGCSHLRKGMELWCTQHLDTPKRYGHPSARPLQPKLWSTERQRVRDVLAENEQHQGLKNGIAYLRSLMDQASQNEKATKSAPELARLVRHGVTPRDVLTELAAFWTWQWQNPRALPDQKAWDFACSRCVFAMAPRPRKVIISAGRTNGMEYSTKPNHSALGHLGAHLRVTLGPLLGAIKTAVEQREEAAKATLQALRAPLAQPTSVFIAEAASQVSDPSSAVLAAASAGLDRQFLPPSLTSPT